MTNGWTSKPLNGWSFDARTVAPAFNAHDTRGRLISMRELQGMVFAPVNTIIPDLLVEGLTIFAGRPKIGKSWLMLNWAIEVAANNGDVAYLALEDNFGRLQSRLQKLLGNELWPERGLFQTEWPRHKDGGLNGLRTWLQTQKSARLVIIDTLKMFRMPRQKGQDAYEADYEALSDLRSLASENRIAVVVVHHTRKTISDDPYDDVSGTLGLTGAPDSILILRHGRQGGFELYGCGRDLPEFEKAATFDPETCKWVIADKSDDAARSHERNVILQALRQANTPLTPAQIAIATTMKPGNVRFLLHRMVSEGEVIRTEMGYITNANTANAHR